MIHLRRLETTYLLRLIALSMPRRPRKKETNREPDFSFHNSPVMSLDLELTAAMSLVDPAPPLLFRSGSDSFRLRLRSSEVLDLLDDSEKGLVPPGRRRLTFGSDEVVVVIDLLPAGGKMAIAGVVHPRRPGWALLRAVRYAATLDMAEGSLSAASFPRSPFSVAVEFLDGRRVHTDWVLP